MSRLLSSLTSGLVVSLIASETAFASGGSTVGGQMSATMTGVLLTGGIAVLVGIGWWWKRRK